MKPTLKKLLESAGKNTTVHFEGKEKRTKFDENFGKDKLDIINKALGDDQNKQLIFQKLSK